MTEKERQGIFGENRAKKHLENEGYRILELNWRHRRAEIDIIAMKDEVLVFVEVKTRKNDIYGTPESFISERKRRLYYDAASVYMEKIQHTWEIRFDVISVVRSTEELQHFEDAFFFID